MSVINQMLKDLEQRDQRAPAALNPLPSQRSSKPAGANSWRWWLIVAALILLGVTWFLLTVGLDSNEPAQPVEPVVSKVADARFADELLQPNALATQTNSNMDASGANNSAEFNKISESNDISKQLADVALQSVPLTPREKPNEQTVAPALPPEPKAAVQQIKPKSAPAIKPQAKEQAAIAITEVKLSQDELAQSKYSKALNAIDAGNISDAQGLLVQVLAIKPDMTEARARLASLYYGQQNNAQAITTLKEGLRLLPGNVEFRLMLARLYQQGSNPQQALSYLNEGPLPAASEVDFYALRGALAQSLKRYTIAAESYQMLSKYQPEQGRWWLGWGVAADAQGEWSVARQAFAQALATSSLSSAARSYAEQRIQQLGGE